MKKSSLKKIINAFEPKLQSEGVGAQVKRVLGSKLLKRLDPFLMMGKSNQI